MALQFLAAGAVIASTAYKAARLLWKPATMAFGAARGFLGRNLTLGGAAAVATAATAIPAIDNATGNKASEFLFKKTPAAPILEGLFNLKSWANDQPAKVIQNLIENKLHENGKIDQDNPEYQDSDYQTIVESMTHFATGDVPGAVLKLGKIKDVELKEADLIASYRRVEEENPDADMTDKCALIVQDMHETIQKRREIEQKDMLDRTHLEAISDADITKPSILSKAASEKTITTAAIATAAATTKATITKAQNTFDLSMLSGKDLTDAFDKATDRMSFTGFLLKAVSGLVGIFSDNAQAMIQKMTISSLDAEDKYEVLRDVCSRGNGVSANNNTFNLSGIIDKTMDLVPE